jgi:protein SCO1/2
MFRVLSVLTVGVALLATGCGPSADSSRPASVAVSTNQRSYQVKGVVLEVLPAEKTVRIKHEEVPGYMQAMTMPFEVRDVTELAGLGPGDPVMFRLTVTDTDGWIDQIRKTGARTNVLPTTGPLRLVRDVDPLNVGDVLPEYHFTNQLGVPFSTSQFKGQVLAINFIFTRCPFAPYCPQTAKYFSEIQQRLLALPNAPANWHLLTISFDPEFDTPEVLKAYADNYHADPQRWTFATGALIDITAICDQFGLTFFRDEPSALPQHTLRTVVIDPAGRVQTIIGGNEWKPDDLLQEMLKAAGAK